MVGKIILPQTEQACDTLIDVLEYRAQAHNEDRIYQFLPDQGGDPQKMTYPELAKRAQAIAAILQKKLKVGDRALLIYPPGLELIAAYFGCLYAGVIAVPVYPPLNAHLVEKIQHVIEDAKPNILLSTQNIVKKLRQLRLLKFATQVPLVKQVVKRLWHREIEITRWDLNSMPWLTTDDISFSAASQWQRPDITSDHLAFLQYTSGSTGHPKGVMVSHENLLHNLEIIHNAFGIHQNSSAVIWLPPYHDMGLIGGIIQALYEAANCTLMSPMRFLQSPYNWLEAISQYRATVSGGPNFAYDYCAKKITSEQKAKLDLSSWELAFNGAEPVHADTIERFYEAFKECGFRKEAFYPCYGLAEATLFVSGKVYQQGSQVEYFSKEVLLNHRIKTTAASEPKTKVLVNCGCPAQNVCIIDPKNHSICQTDEVGEIWVHSASVAKGYWQRPEETKKTFHAHIRGEQDHQNYLRTGDLGFIHDGCLYVTGRLGDLIIIHGRNYYPQDIERTVGHCHPLIRSGSCAAFAIEIDAEQRLVILCEIQPVQEKADEIYAELCQIVANAVAHQHELVTHEIALISPHQLPKTTSGKIRRRYAKELFEAQKLFSLYQWINQDVVSKPVQVQTEVIPERFIERYKKSSHGERPILLRQHLKKLFREVLAIGNEIPIQEDQSFFAMGMDSLKLLDLKNKLQDSLGSSFILNNDIIFYYTTITELAGYLEKNIFKKSIEPIFPQKIVNMAPAIVQQKIEANLINKKYSIEFSLFYFSSKAQTAPNAENYRLLKEGAIFADQHDFTAVWTPERHFHAFGGLFPNSALTSAYIAAITKNIRIRAGSVILPLRNPINVAEDFALVDQLSNGRVDMSVGQGWNPNDFVFYPEKYPKRLEVLYNDVETIKKLWRGESIEALNGNNEKINIQIFPRPVQPELNVWLTCSGSIERFIEAGERGFNIITALLFQDVAELSKKIAAYRDALKKHGFDPNSRTVTLMLHTFVGKDLLTVKEIVRKPFIEYLKSSVDLWSKKEEYLARKDKPDEAVFFQAAFERYFNRSALIGSVDTTRLMVESLKEAGVNEIACLIDFGVDVDTTIENLQYLNELFLSTRQEKNKYPLSFEQERLWFLEKLDPGNICYNEVDAIRLKSPSGLIEMNMFKQAFENIAARHAILRTTFVEENGNVMQVVNENPKLDIRLAHELPLALVRTPFDLTTGPLWRSVIVQVKQNEFIIFYIRHHIISDGWSMKIMIREIGEYVNKKMTGNAPSLTALPLQYADFATQQRNETEKESFQQQLNYWHAQLANAPSHINLPTDYTRPPIQTYHGKEKSFAFSPELTQKLTQFCQQQDVTLFMFLLAVFNLLLYHYSGEHDIVVGTPIANRNSPKIWGLIGFFANMLALRNQLDPKESFAQLLLKVKECTLGGYAHQDFPFSKVVEVVSPKRDLSLPPLFQVMLVLQQEVENEFLNLAPLIIERYPIEAEIAQFDITLILEKQNGILSGKVVYNTDLYNHVTIEKFTEHFINLTENVINNYKQPIGNINYLSSAEQKKILVEWNNTEQDFPKNKTIPQLFAQQVEKTPDDIAITFVGKSLTYRELDARANQLAHYLMSLGVKADNLVAINLERSLDLVVGILGILKANAVYVPLDPSYPQERIRSIIDEAKIKWILDNPTLWHGYPSHNPNLPAQATQLAYVIYTSGSTGKPKGVQIRQQSVVNFLWSMQSILQLHSTDTWLAVTTIAFDIAGLEIFLPLVTGARVVLASRENAMAAEQLIDLLQSNHVTIMQATPVTWKMLVEGGWAGSKEFKILCGGEALPQTLANALQKRGRVWNLYGPTETTIWSTFSILQTGKPVNLGKPIGNTQIYILDEALQPVPVGVPGELYIGGMGVAQGYINRPDLTAERFILNPFQQKLDEKMYRTGDLCRWLADGSIEYIRRIDYQVKIRGFRVELGEIELALKKHPWIKDVVVIVREDQPNEKRLVAYWIPKNFEFLPSMTELRVNLKQNLPEYMIPSAFVMLEDFPLTPNGKLDRKALPMPEQPLSTQGYVAPRTNTEQALAKIWCDVLKLKQVGIHDNFFELGGYSILATQLMVRVHKTIDKDCPLNIIFKAPTIAEFAKMLTIKPGKKKSTREIGRELR